MKKEEKTGIDKLKLDFSKMILGSILLNVLFLILGIVIYMNPYITANTVGILIGIYFIIMGFFAIYEFFMRSVSPIFKIKIFMGVLSILIGIFVIFNPFKIVKILTFALGIYLIVLSIVKALEALNLKKYGYDGWLITLVTGVLILIFGIFIAINPMASMDIIKATGIFVILSSLLEICNLVMIYGGAKDIVKLFEKGI